MGAQWFETAATGDTLDEAFEAAREQALCEHGRAGYTGTVAEKFSVVDLLPGTILPSAEEASRAADDLSERVVDKRGPAGAVRYDVPGDLRRHWLIFGRASS
jgi:hypothetical protein